MNILVVPTIRENSIKDFLKKWERYQDWDKIIVVEDNPQKTFDIDVDYHYSWKEIEEDLESDAWIISKRDSGIRSYGFLKAYQMGAKYIFSLDDDCYPIEGTSFCKNHIYYLENQSRWTESALGFRTRGIPYKNLGSIQNVMFNVGLWEGVPDHDAINALAHNNPIVLSKSRIIPKGQYFPFCGMNFAFKREVTPLAYFAPMGEGQPFNRYEDIWFGVICKKICDQLNYHIACGEPYIFHSRQSDPFDNLIKEAKGTKYNESFWQIIDQISLRSYNSKGCIMELGHRLELIKDEYLNNYGKALKIWSSKF